MGLRPGRFGGEVEVQFREGSKLGSMNYSMRLGKPASATESGYKPRLTNPNPVARHILSPSEIQHSIQWNVASVIFLDAGSTLVALPLASYLHALCIALSTTYLTV